MGGNFIVHRLVDRNGSAADSTLNTKCHFFMGQYLDLVFTINVSAVINIWRELQSTTFFKTLSTYKTLYINHSWQHLNFIMLPLQRLKPLRIWLGMHTSSVYIYQEICHVTSIWYADDLSKVTQGLRLKTPFKELNPQNRSFITKW